MGVNSGPAKPLLSCPGGPWLSLVVPGPLEVKHSAVGMFHQLRQVSKALPLQTTSPKRGGKAFAFATGLVVQDHTVPRLPYLVVAGHWWLVVGWWWYMVTVVGGWKVSW